MGTRQEFICGTCGYAVVVSGGRGRGFFAETVTVSCFECAQLHDVVIEEGKLEIFELNGIEVVGLKCPDNPRHMLTEWDLSGPLSRLCCQNGIGWGIDKLGLREARAEECARDQN